MMQSSLAFSRIIRSLAALFILFGGLSVFSTETLAQVPVINLPLVPDATAPGGPDFTLTVNGTGFVSGAVVNWNGSPLATQFVSGSQLTATVPAADIALPSTASVTVVGPPGTYGGISNVAFFTVSTPPGSVLFGPAYSLASNSPTSIAAGDFNGDGRMDVAVASFSGETVSILHGNGNGTFQSSVEYGTLVWTGPPTLTTGPTLLVTGDFVNDGGTDLATYVTPARDNAPTIWALLDHETIVDFDPGDAPPTGPIAAFGGNLAVGGYDYRGSTVSVCSAQEAWAFARVYVWRFECQSFSLARWVELGYFIAGDFNGDGNLDLAVANPTPMTVSIFEGPDFAPSSTAATGLDPLSIGVGDFNGDGKLDLAVVNQGSNSVSILLGDGTGNFAVASSPAVGSKPVSIALGDFNGDGNLDLAVANEDSNTVSILLGDGTGNFTLIASPATGLNPASVAVGDFNSDGRLDLAVANGGENTISILLQSTTVSLSPSATLDFGSQVLGVTSTPQTVTLSNTGSATLTISSLVADGDFAQTNTCGNSLAAGETCAVNVTFTPTQAGSRTGTITITDNAADSPQIVSLTGTGAAAAVTLSVTSLAFTGQAVGTTSGAQTVTLTNTGSATLTITSIAASGDFAESNTCGASVAAGKSCTLTVSFTPAGSGVRTGAITITDNAPGSPQVVTLTGIGTGPTVALSASTMSIGSEIVGTTSGAHTVTLTNSGNAALNITGLTISPASFTETNTCGSSLAAGASCNITVTFTPSVAGEISGTLNITDNAVGSPQQVALSGVGQDFGIGPYNLTQPIPAGWTAAYDLAVWPDGGFNQAVSLACSGAPQQSSCTVTPTSTTLDGRTHAVITLRVLTSAPASVPPRDDRPLSLPLGWLLAAASILLLLLLMSSIETGRRTTPTLRLRLLTFAVTLLLIVLLWVGCGAGSSSVMSPPPTGGTPSGTYVVTVTATSGHLSHAITVQLTVK